MVNTYSYIGIFKYENTMFVNELLSCFTNNNNV